MLSLTHLYTFNDGTATDSVGGADGTLHNGASVVDGKLVLLNEGVTSGASGDVQHVQLPAGLLPDAGAATIEVWYAAAYSPNWARVFDFGSQVAGAGETYVYLTPQSGNNDSRAVFQRAGASEFTATGATTDDGAMRVAAVVIDPATASMRLYVDGVERGSVGLGRGANVGLVDDTLNYLGRSLYSNDPGFTGLIDEVRIYDEALPAGQIALNAASGAAAVVLAGDYDGSGVVDADDYSVWVGAYGSITNLAADGNGDGVVNAADYTVWRDNLGAGGVTPPDQILNDESLTVGGLSNTTIELTGQSELHITSNRIPLSGSEVRLNSEDAWLFFENIKPSEVVANYLSQVRVNGGPAINGITARVVQHELGTVVIPHAFDYQPFEAFSGPQFTGDTQSFGLYEYYTGAGDLGVMNRNLSSFKLKRGYMATIATNPDGTGLSKVYVAQDHDLEVSLLPEDYDNRTQFLRVFPWRWVSKKGASDIAPETLDAAWHYNWNNSLDSTLDWEYVPIKQQLYWPADPTNKTDVTHWLGFNEPNNPVEDAYQSLGNGSVDAAIAYWPNMLKTGLRVGSPAVTDGGKAWLYEFMDKAIANNLRVDYIAIHNYQANHSASSLYNWLKDVYDRYHLPIWITEFNNGANWTGSPPASNSANAAVIGSFIDMMDTTPWIERYSIYSRVEAVRELTYSDGSLTPTGQVYHDNDSPIGYLQEIAAPGNTAGRSVAQLNFEGDTLDASGYGYNGHVAGVSTYAPGVDGQAIDLDGSTNYVQLPEDVASGDSFSFAGWVKWDGGGAWQRIFDFGNDTSSNLFLTPSNGSSMRFAIKNGGGEQVVQAAPLPVGQWTHVAVTLGGGQAKLYVNGTLVGTNNSVTIKPSDFRPTRNFLGDSQWASDPLLNGQLDDVLITDYVLTPTQIAGLMNNSTPSFSSNLIELGPATLGTLFRGTLAGAATDPAPGTNVTYSKANGPSWLTVAANGALSGTPTLGDLGTQEFVISATNADGAIASTVLTIDVTAAAMASFSDGSGGNGLFAALTAFSTGAGDLVSSEAPEDLEVEELAGDDAADLLLLAAVDASFSEDANERDDARISDGRDGSESGDEGVLSELETAFASL